MSSDDILAVLIDVADRNGIQATDTELEMFALEIGIEQDLSTGRHALAA